MYHTSIWIKENRLDKYIKDVTNNKIPAFLYIDDRSINFNGNYEELICKINTFRPYWEKEDK